MEGVYLTLWFDAKKLRNFLIQFKQSSGECSRGVLYTAQKEVSCCRLAARHRGRIIYIHRRGAFGVARFDWMGNAKAS